MKRFSTLSLLCLTGGIGWTGQAASAAEPATRFEEVVVTATKARTPKKEVTRAVTVVPGEDLGETKGGSVVEGLRSVPGTFVRQSGSTGRTTSLVILCASPTQVHVTLDGAHVASPTLGSFDFNNFAPDNLEKVEVLRGPGSVLYGSDAMGGVVNFETLRGEGPFRGSYTQEAGSRDTFREAGSFQGAVGPWHLSGSLSRLDTEGVSQNDDYQNTTFSGRVGYDLGPQHTLDISVRHFLAIVGIDDGAFRPDPNRRDRERQTIGSVKWQKPFTSWWTSNVRFSTSIASLIDNDPSNGGTEANTLSKLSTERYGAEWRNRFTPVEWDAVTAGIEFEDREADRRTGGANQNFSKAQTTRALYLQNQWNPIRPLTVLTGARWFRESSFGSDHVVDASAAYLLTPLNFKLRGGYGQGFRVPSLNELFFPNFGNPNLQAEKSETIEAGWEQILFQELLEWSATFFRTNYQDLIQITKITATTSGPVNVGKARVDGIELETELRPWKGWSAKGTYTYLKANDRATGEELLRIPQSTLGLGVGCSPGRWEVRLDGLFVGSREESTGTNSRNKTEGYFKLDLYARYQFKDWLRGFVRLENLTDRKYQEILGFPSPGFTATAGVTIEK